MPIAFHCACGKSFSVKDDFAGKKTKCPACGAGLVVPQPAEPSAEDDAFRMLESAESPDRSERPPPRYDWGGQVDAAPAPEPPAPPSKPAPATKKKKRSPTVHLGEGEERSRFRIALSPAVAGGLTSMLICGIIMLVSLDSGRIPIGAIIVFFFGLVAVIKGCLGYAED